MGIKNRFLVKHVSVALLSSLVAVAFARAESPPDASVATGATPVRPSAAGVVSSAERAPVDSSDDVIRRGVEKALHDLDAPASADIDVSVKDGIVRLSGTVPTWQGNDSRMSATRSVNGVRAIINGLRVVAPRPDRR